MNFYYNGRKPSKGYDVASGCLLLIGITAMFYFFSLIDDWEDLEGHYLQLIFILLVGGSMIFSLFQKKGKLHTHRIEIKNNFLLVHDIKIPLETIQLDVYVSHDQFSRYHFFDTSGLFTIFSVYEDDLVIYFQENFTHKTNFYEEVSSKNDGGYITVRGNNRTLYYNLDVGKYTLKTKDAETISYTPQVYVYDPKYKQGKPLLKK